MTLSHLLNKDSILNVDTSLTNTDLSNLSNTGEAHFTNPNLSNLSTIGKQFVAFKGYDSTTTYSLNDVVVSIQNNEVKIYQSLVENNTSPLTDDTKWKEVSLGGSTYTAGTGINITNDVISSVALVITDYTAE